MDTVNQGAQPVPLFYGPCTADVDISIPLAAGFDYVLTFVYFQPLTAASGLLTINDENGVQILSTACNSAGQVMPGQGLLAGEIPIGPRTALTLQVAGVNAHAIVTGYALTPPSMLHI